MRSWISFQRGFHLSINLFNARSGLQVSGPIVGFNLYLQHRAYRLGLALPKKKGDGPQNANNSSICEHFLRHLVFSWIKKSDMD